MKINFSNIEHDFVIDVPGESFNLADFKHILYLKNPKDVLFNRELKMLLQDADKIIVSGVWNEYIALWSECFLGKTYLQLWGGDFYGLRDRKPFYHLRATIHRQLRMRILKKCRAIIFLLNAEHKPFTQITGIEKPFFAAPVPTDPLKKINYTTKKLPVHNEKPRIQVGNSGTKENHHVEVFHLLKKWKKQIEVIVPLSYGNPNYIQETLAVGNELLGPAFHPLTKMMPLQEYTNLLSSCQVAVFNNDRQQAMGNINTALMLGTKLYLRNGTSMWEQYGQEGFILHDVKALETESLTEALFIDEHEKYINLQAIKRHWSPELAKEQWQAVFNS